jgi:hypothetical protein
MRAASASEERCFRHALVFWPMARRSLIIAAIVGTILTAINQGNLIVQGEFPVDLAWKVPLTYCVPYLVATTGALLNARRA